MSTPTPAGQPTYRLAMTEHAVMHSDKPLCTERRPTTTPDGAAVLCCEDEQHSSTYHRNGDYAWTTPAFTPQTAARVVVLCGSTRFRAEFAAANREQTLAGRIVLAPGVFGHSGDPMTDEQKTALDALHFRKIDMADEVIVVCPGGYIGQSTRNEIAYAKAAGKTITYDRMEATR